MSSPGALNRFLSQLLRAPEASPRIVNPHTNLAIKAVMMRPWHKGTIALLAVLSTSCGLLVPYLQRQFVNGLAAHSDITLMLWLVYAFLVSFTGQAINFSFRFLATREALLVQRAVSQSLYHKTLQLSVVARGQKTVGETVNYYAQDVPAISMFVEEFLPNVLTVALAICGAPLAVGLFYNLPILEVLSLTAANIGVAIFLGSRQAVFFGLTKSDAQARLAVVNEWLQNMRIIRILGWTHRFEQTIFRLREKETRDRLAMVTNGSTMNSIAQVTPFLINVAAVSALVRAHNQDLTPGDIFSMLWVFGVFLARPLRALPFLITHFTDANTSTRRLEAFFQLEEEHEPEAPTGSSNQPLAAQTTQGLSLSVVGLNLTIGGRELLSDISFDLPAGAFVAIVGEVGAGKTLLLQSLLRTLPSTFSKFSIAGEDVQNLKPSLLRNHFGYVSQEGFVMSATLRENVAFQYNADATHDSTIQNALTLAQFIVENENLTSGLHTEIGERGVNLSGGQRQRVNLARCAFFDRPIILLDDCLSAVDIETEANLNAHLFQGLWGKKTRLMVTHRLSILPLVDWIYFMEDGRLVEKGTFAELSAHSQRMQSFIRAHGRTDRRTP